MGNVHPISDNPNEKWCGSHKCFLDRSKFHVRLKFHDGLLTICKECRRRRDRDYQDRVRRSKGIPIKRQLKHGMHKSPEFKAWWCARQRCEKPKVKCWPSYGGRGIRMCQEWTNSFLAFYLWVGPRPSPEHSIDRIDNDGNYEPGNVRWATKLQQSLNRRACRDKAPTKNEHLEVMRQWRDLHTGPLSKNTSTCE
jgi:hypothetical protein